MKMFDIPDFTPVVDAYTKMILKPWGKSATSLFSLHRDAVLDALIEGKDIPDHDKSDVRTFLGQCMDKYQNDLKIILPIARRVMSLYNWHAFLTFENIDAFLMNSNVRQMCF